jgi:hypothetical protein
MRTNRSSLRKAGIVVVMATVVAATACGRTASTNEVESGSQPATGPSTPAAGKVDFPSAGIPLDRAVAEAPVALDVVVEELKVEPIEPPPNGPAPLATGRRMAVLRVIGTLRGQIGTGDRVMLWYGTELPTGVQTSGSQDLVLTPELNARYVVVGDRSELPSDSPVVVPVEGTGLIQVDAQGTTATVGDVKYSLEDLLSQLRKPAVPPTSASSAG